MLSNYNGIDDSERESTGCYGNIDPRPNYMWWSNTRPPNLPPVDPSYFELTLVVEWTVKKKKSCWHHLTLPSLHQGEGKEVEDTKGMSGLATKGDSNLGLQQRKDTQDLVKTT